MPAPVHPRSQKRRYGVILDAGSSGTRLHIYRWLDVAGARSKADPQQLKSLPIIETKNKWTEKIHPGVSTFGDKPGRVGPDHLEQLFKKARKIIPDDEVERTPLFLLATAGMRLLDDDPREKLLEEICSYAQSNTRFELPDCDLHIKVIPGEVEGLYGWIAANYLLGGFEAPLEHAGADDHPTSGFLDMGGASAQIAFAPSARSAKDHAKDLLLLRLRTVDGTPIEYRVFTTTWLGFGVNQARKHYVERLEKATGGDSNVLQDPCLPSGLTTTTKGDVLLPESKEVNGKVPYINGTGHFDECLKLTYPLLEKDHVCEDDPCLIGGTHVPPIDFSINHFVGVSEYWHTTHEIFEVGHKDKAYDFNTYQKRVSGFCSREWNAIEESVKAHEWGKKVDEKTAIEVCFKASWLINVLHDGIGVPRVGIEDLPDSKHNSTKKLLDSAKEKGFTPSFRPVNKIEGTELSWTLGKMVLYASSQVPPAHKDDLPVGFGENVPGIPADFHYPASSSISGNSSSIIENSSNLWPSNILHAATFRRLPGIILFLVIFGLAGLLLCGRTRRQRIYSRFRASPTRSRRLPSAVSNGKRGSLFASRLPSLFRFSPSRGAYERVLEEGRSSPMVMTAPDDFELDLVDSEDASDSSSGSQAGKTSGWDTPRSRGSNSLNPGAALGGLVARGSSDTLSGLDRAGLVGRADSRERIAGMAEGRRSRMGSPTRKVAGLRLGSLIED